MIPGERDPSTLTHREPGAVGGQFPGGDSPAPAPSKVGKKRTTKKY